MSLCVAADAQHSVPAQLLPRLPMAPLRDGAMVRCPACPPPPPPLCRRTPQAPVVTSARRSGLPVQPAPSWLSSRRHVAVVASAAGVLGGLLLAVVAVAVKRRTRVAMARARPAWVATPVDVGPFTASRGVSPRPAQPLHAVGVAAMSSSPRPVGWRLGTHGPGYGRWGRGGGNPSLHPAGGVAWEGCSGSRGGTDVHDHGGGEGQGYVVTASGQRLPWAQLWQLGRVNARMFPGGSSKPKANPMLAAKLAKVGGACGRGRHVPCLSSLHVLCMRGLQGGFQRRG